jgi:hypothetical protein
MNGGKYDAIIVCCFCDVDLRRSGFCRDRQSVVLESLRQILRREQPSQERLLFKVRFELRSKARRKVIAFRPVHRLHSLTTSIYSRQ